MLTDEIDVSNYRGVNIHKNSDGTIELFQLHMTEKIFNHVRLTVSVSLKCREMPAGKPMLHKDKYILGRKRLWNCKEAVLMLSYIQGGGIPETSMAVH